MVCSTHFDVDFHIITCGTPISVALYTLVSLYNFFVTVSIAKNFTVLLENFSVQTEKHQNRRVFSLFPIF